MCGIRNVTQLQGAQDRDLDLQLLELVKAQGRETGSSKVAAKAICDTVSQSGASLMICPMQPRSRPLIFERDKDAEALFQARAEARARYCLLPILADLRR